MKLKKGYILQKDGNDYLLVSDGSNETAADMLGFSNDTAYIMLEKLAESDGSLTKEELVDMLYEIYDAPREVIETDVENFLKKLADIGVI